VEEVSTYQPLSNVKISNICAVKPIDFTRPSFQFLLTTNKHYYYL